VRDRVTLPKLSNQNPLRLIFRRIIPSDNMFYRQYTMMFPLLAMITQFKIGGLFKYKGSMYTTVGEHNHSPKLNRNFQ
jgi:hypothetical protein